MRAVVCLMAMGLAGCAGADRVFRSQVGEVDVSAGNNYSDARTGITDDSQVGVAFKLRDPAGDGKEILPAN